MITWITDLLIDLFFKLEWLRLLLRAALIVLSVLYLLTALALSFYFTEELVYNPFVVLSPDVLRAVYLNPSSFTFSLWAIQTALTILILWLWYYKSYRRTNNKFSDVSPRTIPLADLAKYWLPAERMQKVKKAEVEYIFAFMKIKDTVVDYFANQTFKPLLDNRDITATHGAIIDKIVNTLQDYGRLAPSVSRFAGDPNEALRKQKIKSEQAGAQSHYDIFAQVPLLDHSIRVANKIVENQEIKDSFKMGSAVVAALAHDLGKLDVSFITNEHIKRACHLKPHQVKSKIILKNLIDNFRTGEISESEIEQILEAVENHHLNVISPDKIAANPLITALIDADKAVRAQELELYSEGNLRLLKDIEPEAPSDLQFDDKIAQEEKALHGEVAAKEVSEENDIIDQFFSEIANTEQSKAKPKKKRAVGFVINQDADEVKAETGSGVEINSGGSEKAQDDTKVADKPENQQKDGGSRSEQSTTKLSSTSHSDSFALTAKAAQTKENNTTNGKPEKPRRPATLNLKKLSELKKESADSAIGQRKASANSASKANAGKEKLSKRSQEDDLLKDFESVMSKHVSLSKEDEKALLQSEVKHSSLDALYKFCEGKSEHVRSRLKIIVCLDGLTNGAEALSYTNDSLYQVNSYVLVLTNKSEDKILEKLAEESPNRFDVYRICAFSPLELTKMIVNYAQQDRENRQNVRIVPNYSFSKNCELAYSAAIERAKTDMGLEFDFNKHGIFVINKLASNINSYDKNGILTISHGGLLLASRDYIARLLAKSLELSEKADIDAAYKYFSLSCFKAGYIKYCRPDKGYFYSKFALTIRGSEESFHCLAFLTDKLRIKPYQLENKNEYMRHIGISKPIFEANKELM